MRFCGKRFGGVLAGLVMLAGAAHAESASTEDTAKFLAGLPVSASSPLAALQDTPAARQHEAFFNTTFQRVDRTQIDKVKAWSAEHIDVKRKTLFYFFSGPDFLYANAFFPDAETYVLAGLESPGPVPDLMALPKGALPKALRGLEVSMRSILGLSFFQTKFMSGEFYFNPVKGTIPVIYIFMARSGKEVHSAQLIQLDENGDVLTDVKMPRPGAAKGVKITFSSPGGPEQTLYYFSANVVGAGFKSSGLEAFADKLGRGDAFVKSASYLLHGRDFAGIRSFILNHADAVLQDDTGIPIYLYDKTWTLTPYGNYVGPIRLFARAFQPQLAALHRKSPKSPIDFSIGYRYRPHEASIVWAVKKPETEVATPKPASAPTKPTNETKPAEAAKPPEAPKPAEEAKPTEAAKPKEEAKPTEVTKPADDTKADDAKAKESAKPADPAPAAAMPDEKPTAGEGAPKEAPKPAAPEPVEKTPDSAPTDDKTVAPKNEPKPSEAPTSPQ